MFAIINVSIKNISKIINEFEKLPYKGYVRKRTKHEPTESYFYLARQLEKCTMIADYLNSYVDPARMEMTSMQIFPISHVCSKDESE